MFVFNHLDPEYLYAVILTSPQFFVICSVLSLKRKSKVVFQKAPDFVPRTHLGIILELNLKRRKVSLSFYRFQNHGQG